MLLYRRNLLLGNRFAQAAISRGFHSTAKRSFTIPFLPILPQKPGGVIGTPNEAYKSPRPNKLEGSFHWWLEKAFAVTSFPLATAALFTTGPLSTTCDSIFCLGLLGYYYMEFHSCITDYISSRVYGKIHNYAMYLLGAGTFVSLFGIYKLESETGGFVGIVKKLWAFPSITSNKMEDEVTVTSES
ncbi:hypothetical protein KAFR_0B06070 [Kazachstania africana CBS 2517]|uniref:Succinate dehydrogenase [ubiquinone] cytochrome b small subunit n=1 Tax=Kazachstania africana (strain ATCC 22294 / BCRC 22015 / CBS 2517 / CECT 1963 / NBRC 1671 / NRRL Y-8276) TaxID=1071382 RepID=H2ARA3_KAZAF|nr:hypothetical protein KAFR_0B06070 [Kazachstania africana CBS 2517]CCF56903.1 hypothetical protein KAFR_0B06070 [Kazachstania africana CBS 2517]